LGYGMEFTNEQLGKFSRWESVEPGYNRDIAEADCPIINGCIKPLLNDLSSIQDVFYQIFDDGGMSNYYSFFLYKSKRKVGRLSGLMIYFSLLAPVGVFGQATVFGSFGSSFSGARSGLEPEEVCDPEELSGELETLFIQYIKTTPYRLLTPQEVLRPLPDDITPTDYCLCSKPWDKVFHVLFSNTD
jgi:hypothetical protein